MNVEIYLAEVPFPVFLTLKLSHLVSQQRNTVSIASLYCSPYWKNTTRRTFRTSFLVASTMTVASSYLHLAPNDRKTYTANLCEQVRKLIAQAIDGDEDYFCIDSKPIPVCRFARAKRCKLGKNDFETAPNYGFCAAQTRTITAINCTRCAD